MLKTVSEEKGDNDDENDDDNYIQEHQRHQLWKKLQYYDYNDAVSFIL